jgi:hypothetical protein
MTVVHLGRLAPHQSTARDERPEEGRIGSGWRVITARPDPRGRKARPITDVISTALGKEDVKLGQMFRKNILPYSRWHEVGGTVFPPAKPHCIITQNTV